MFRRTVLERLACAAGGALTLRGSQPQQRATAIYRVKGFSCPACAVGLDTILGRQQGVLRSHSTYPAGMVTVEFDRAAISDKAIALLIAEQGFTIERAQIR